MNKEQKAKELFTQHELIIKEIYEVTDRINVICDDLEEKTYKGLELLNDARVYSLFKSSKARHCRELAFELNEDCAVLNSKVKKFKLELIKLQIRSSKLIKELAYLEKPCKERGSILRKATCQLKKSTKEGLNTLNKQSSKNKAAIYTPYFF